MRLALSSSHHVRLIGCVGRASGDIVPVPRNYKRNYYGACMELQWDASKAALNLHKHGVAFEDAERVFYDLGRIETYDCLEVYGEDRWATIGMVHSVLLYVVYTVRREECIRLISARKANASEQKRYREANP